jgi:hypothetical protein
MSYFDTVGNHAEDPEQLELLYQEAVKAGEADAFKQAIDASYVDMHENLLYAAWFYRLKVSAERAKSFAVAWGWAIPLALLNALLFWWLSDEQYMVAVERFSGRGDNYIPTIILLAGPLCAVFILTYLVAVSRKQARTAIVLGVVVVIAAAYVLLVYPQLGIRTFQEQYLNLMALHLPLLCWAAIGAYVVVNHRDPFNRFSFLIKSLEVLIMAGLFAIAGGLFTGITFGLFSALDVDFPETIQRLFIAGGVGVIAVIAVAVIYNPRVPAADQSFSEGLSKLIALLMRVLLPLTLIVLLVYLIFIPFNFDAPFDNRDVLIIFNAMLFAVVALLVGATPVSRADLSPRVARWLRNGIIAVAALALIVSVYALAAIIYRTSLDRLTPNRLTFIGWNVINIGLLSLILLLQWRGKDGQWLNAMYRAFSYGTVAYAVWTVVVILALPWLFGANLDEVETLPVSIQQIVYDNPGPILLKCSSSPHIYLLDGAEKRWISSIETFNERGYLWRDVEFVLCDDLQRIPDDVSIPPEAGLPPQPD